VVCNGTKVTKYTKYYPNISISALTTRNCKGRYVLLRIRYVKVQGGRTEKPRRVGIKATQCRGGGVTQPHPETYAA
jgi:hypothetical protein